MDVQKEIEEARNRRDKLFRIRDSINELIRELNDYIDALAGMNDEDVVY